MGSAPRGLNPCCSDRMMSPPAPSSVCASVFIRGALLNALAVATVCASACTDVAPYHPQGGEYAWSILPLGDSLTQGKEDEASYLYYLDEILTDRDVASLFIGTRAGGGGGLGSEGHEFDAERFPNFTTALTRAGGATLGRSYLRRGPQHRKATPSHLTWCSCLPVPTTSCKIFPQPRAWQRREASSMRSRRIFRMQNS